MKLAIPQQNTFLTHIYMYVSSLAAKTGNALRAFPATTFLPLMLLLVCFFAVAPQAHALTISGTLYHDEGATAMATTTTIAMAVGTSTVSLHSTTTNTSGVWTFNLAASSIGTSTNILVWVDASSTFRGAAFTRASSSINNITGLSIYRDHLIIRHEGTSATTTRNRDLAFYDGDNDTDIMFYASSTLLTVKNNQEIYIPAGKTFAPSGAVTAIHIKNLGIFSGPTTTLTVGGNFENTGTFTTNGATTTFTGIGITASGTFVGSSALGNVSVATGTGGDYFNEVFDESGAAMTMETLLFDPVNRVMYASGDAGVGIYRCDTATRCDAQSDWALATDTPDNSIDSMVLDSTNNVIYAGTWGAGYIFKCATSSGCNGTGDWTIATDTPETAIKGMGFDSTNNVLYAGAYTTGRIYRCVTSTGCDSAGDWSVATDTAETDIREFFFDSTNGVMYAATEGTGYILRCLVSTGCDGVAEWTIAYKDTTASGIYTFTFDSRNNVLYAGGNFGIIFRCALSTSCDQQVDWSAPLDNSEESFESMAFDAVHGVLYAGTWSTGVIYRCDVSSACDAQNEWVVTYDYPGPQKLVRAMTLDTANNVMYMTVSGTGGKIYRRDGNVTLTANASTTSFTIGAQKALVAPPSLTISGNFTNNGTFTHGSGTITFSSSTAAQTAAGTMTGTSTFYNLAFEGAANKTFVTNASTSNFAINGTATVTAPTHLSVSGNYTNNGRFNGLGSWILASSSSLGTWREVAYGNGIFVAIGQTTANRVMTSPDGITWTARVAAEANNWNAITYGNGLFVAVATNGTNRVMTSPDGITWTARLATELNEWYGITYGNGLFVAVANTGTNRVMTSPDGIVWTARSAAEPNTWRGVTYGNGLFVATAVSGTNQVMTSPDGITWTPRSAPGGGATTWRTVAYGNGRFVAVAYNGNDGQRSMTSPDGITWTAATTTPVIKPWFQVTYGNGYFVASASSSPNSSQIAISADGVNWTEIASTSGSSYDWRGIAYGNGRFVVVNAAVTSTSGNVLVGLDNTLTFNGSSAQSITGSTTDTSQFRKVAFSGAGTKTFNGTYASTTDFTIQSGSGAVVAPPQLDIAGDYTNNGTFTAGSGTTTFSGRLPQVATGTMTGTSAFNHIAINGETEKTFGANASTSNLTIFGTTTALNTPSKLSVSGNYTNRGKFNGVSPWASSRIVKYSWSDIAYGNGIFVAITSTASTTGNAIATSPDGINWTMQVAPSTDGWWSITYGAGLFVALANSGTNRIMTSSDGINWYAFAAPEASYWRDVTYGNGRFVAIASTGTNRAMWSSDGITWATSTPPASSWLSITYGQGLFVAVGTGIIMTSPDGITWTSRTSPGADQWWAVTFGSDRFVAVGNSGTNRTMSSPDGITWTASPAAEITQGWYDVAYGNGLYVAVGNATSTNNAIMTSADGRTWISQSPSTTALAQSFYLEAVAYGNGRFVAVNQLTCTFCAHYIEDNTLTFNGSSAQSITGSTTDTSQFRKVAFSGAGTKTFNGTYASTTDFTIQSGSGAVVAPPQLDIAGDYTNNGTFTAGSGTTTFMGRMAQTASGTMTGTSAFYNLKMIGGSAKTFITNASTTNLAINGSSTAFNMPPQLSISGNYTNTNGKTLNNSDWAIGSTSVNVGSWNGVTYANGLFVAVGDATTGEGVMTSLDGITWTPRVAAQANTWRAVTYGEGLFVAVAYDGTNRIMTSSDGITWTPQTTPTVTSFWADITYGNGTFVATASNCGIPTECVMTSPNGTSWATSTLPASDFMNINGLIYGNGLFVGVGTSSIGGAFTSPDGITWTAWSTPGQATGGWWRGVAYDNGLFVAVNSGEFYGGTYAVMTSPDGMNWTGRVPGLAGRDWTDITYGNGLFVATENHSGGALTLYSSDGTNWATTTVPNSDNSWKSIAYGNGRFVAVANSSPYQTDMVMSSTMFGPDGTTTFNGTSQQVATGTLTGTSGFHNLQISNTSGAGSSTQSVLFGAKASSTGTFSMTASTSVRLPANATSTFQNIRLAGEAGQYTWLRSSVAGTRAGMYVPGTQQLLSYVNVRDNNACPTTMLATNGTSYDAGNNTCWDFYDLGFSSAANQTFSMGQATTAISMITLVDDSPAVITATNDIRIRIATSTANMRWDTSDVTATFGGPASTKVSNPVSYENGGTTLVVPIANDLAAGETLTISDLSFGNFISTSTAASSSLALYTGGAGDVTVDKWDTKTIGISGGLTLANHASGQVGDAFSNASEVDAELFAFRLTPSGENITVTSLAFELQGVTGIVTANFTNARLYRDMNANKVYDAGDTAVGGSGAVAINGQSGTVTFSTSFSATTSQNYLLIGDLTSLTGADGLVVALTGDDIVATGALTNLSVTENGTISNSQHMKVGQGGGGVGSEIGGAAPTGQTRSGGGGGGGDTADSNGGTTIGNEPGFNPPTGNGSPFGTWTSGANAYSSDGLYATSAGQGSRHTYGLFGFNNVPGNSTITGVEVKLEASGSTAAGTISVRLSWDGGTSSTTLQTTGTLTGTDAVYTLGGPSDTWGHVWTPTELNNGNLVIEVVSNPSSNTIQLDAVQVRVYHQVSGGGGGGGGAVYKGQNRFFANVHSALGDHLFSFTDWLFGWLYR